MNRQLSNELSNSVMNELMDEWLPIFWDTITLLKYTNLCAVTRLAFLLISASRWEFSLSFFPLSSTFFRIRYFSDDRFSEQSIYSHAVAIFKIEIHKNKLTGYNSSSKCDRIITVFTMKNCANFLCAANKKSVWIPNAFERNWKIRLAIVIIFEYVIEELYLLLEYLNYILLKIDCFN